MRSRRNGVTLLNLNSRSGRLHTVDKIEGREGNANAFPSFCFRGGLRENVADSIVVANKQKQITDIIDLIEIEIDAFIITE